MNNKFDTFFTLMRQSSIGEFIFFCIMFCGLENANSGTLRIDVEDRAPAEVAKKAQTLGAQMTPAKAVGAVWINGKEISSGVAIDPWTVLTSGHQMYGKKNLKIAFVLHESCQEKPTSQVRGEPIFHPTLIKKSEFSPTLITKNEHNQYMVGNIPIDKLGTLSFEEYKESSFVKGFTLNGTDLCMLKLESPLDLSTPFPKFMTNDKSYSEVASISIGYGTLQYNNQLSGPIKFNENSLYSNKRHVISSTVSNKNLFGISIFAGAYTGLMINGDESFIPNSKMLKTEGIPSGGDSGSPLFIKCENDYELAGIYSNTLSAINKVIKDPIYRSMFASYTQVLFPVWTDMRPVLPWIKSHMGKPI